MAVKNLLCNRFHFSGNANLNTLNGTIRTICIVEAVKRKLLLICFKCEPGKYFYGIGCCRTPLLSDLFSANSGQLYSYAGCTNQPGISGMNTCIYCASLNHFKLCPVKRTRCKVLQQHKCATQQLPNACSTAGLQ